MVISCAQCGSIMVDTPVLICEGVKFERRCPCGHAHILFNPDAPEPQTLANPNQTGE